MSALETVGLTKYYGETRGIEDLTLAVESGEVFGYLGPNGAGKTTTIRTLLGFITPTDGEATVLGYDVRDERALIEAKRHIGYLPSDPGFDTEITGRKLLAYHAELKGDVRSDELLERFDPPVDRDIGEYSRGNVQKLAIVQAFMHDPDLVIMDEPTSGLDPLMQERFYEFVREERDRGTTIFFSSHILSEVRKVCDRVGIIRDGQLVTLEAVETLLDRSGKHVRVVVAEAVERSDFEFEGVHDLTVDGTISFTFTGDYDVLLDHLQRYTVQDLEIDEAPLEDVFMRFYGDEEIDEEASSTVRRPTRPKRRMPLPSRTMGVRTMFEITRYEFDRRVKGAVVLAVLLAVMSFGIVALFPSIETSGADLEAYWQSLPPAMKAAFGASGGAFSLTTMEGFLAVELYQFFWLLLLGIYTAYIAGGLIAGDVERGRLDVLLATPVSRSKVIIEKFLSLVPTLVVLNVIVGAVVYVSVVAIGESVSLSDLVVAHLLSIPYLLACGAIGLLLSVVFDHADVAQRAGLGAIFALFLLDSVASSADMGWLGAISPTHYYDPTAILVSSEYDWTGAVVLLAGIVVLVLVSRVIFQRKDIS